MAPPFAGSVPVSMAIVSCAWLASAAVMLSGSDTVPPAVAQRPWIRSPAMSSSVTGCGAAVAAAAKAIRAAPGPAAGGPRAPAGPAGPTRARRARTPGESLRAATASGASFAVCTLRGASLGRVTAPLRSCCLPTLCAGSVAAAYAPPPSTRKTASVAMTFA